MQPLSITATMADLDKWYVRDPAYHDAYITWSRTKIGNPPSPSGGGGEPQAEEEEDELLSEVAMEEDAAEAHSAHIAPEPAAESEGFGPASSSIRGRGMPYDINKIIEEGPETVQDAVAALKQYRDEGRGAADEDSLLQDSRWEARPASEQAL
jgi:hypothetical protein